MDAWFSVSQLFQPWQEKRSWWGTGERQKPNYLFKSTGYILGRKEGIVLFNDALNTFYLRLYGVTHMVEDHSDIERGKPLPQGLFYMHHPTDRIAHTTAFGTPVVEHCLEREKSQWVHPMKDRSDDPSHHERTLLPRSYISLRVYFRCRIRLQFSKVCGGKIRVCVGCLCVCGGGGGGGGGWGGVIMSLWVKEWGYKCGVVWEGVLGMRPLRQWAAHFWNH